MGKPAAQETLARSHNGFLSVATGLLSAAGGLWLIVTRPMPATILIGLLLFALAAACWAGLYMLQPNQAALLMFFGRYQGTTAVKACAGPTRSTRRPSSACGRATSTARS
jgi:hypothetical protein